MSSFRKHANAGTQCSDSRLDKMANAKKMQTRAASFMSWLLTAAICLSIMPVINAQSVSKSEKAAPRAGEEEAQIAVPMRLHFAGTRQKPLVIATIGDFPANLGEAGKDFLKPEFFEHFISDTLKLGGIDSRPTLKIALLPQSNANEQQCSFTLDDLEGQMSVVVLDRRVLVICTFKLSTGEKSPVNLATIESFYRPQA